MNVQEAAARRYCLIIGADPNEFVWGTVDAHCRIMLPRWQWYVGARV